MTSARRTRARVAQGSAAESAKSSSSVWRRRRPPLLAIVAGAALVAAVLVVAAFLLASGGSSGGGVRSAAPIDVTPGRLVLRPTNGPKIDRPAVLSPYGMARGMSLGASDAPVQLNLWSDYQCPACDAFAGSVMPELVKNYLATGKAQLTIHGLATIGNESLGAAISARCAGRQGKYWQYHDLLYANQAPENSGAFTHARSKQFAAALGLDAGSFGTCLDDTTVEDAVTTETKTGLDQGVKQTPTLYVNGTAVGSANSWEEIKAAIDAALAKS